MAARKKSKKKTKKKATKKKTAKRKVTKTKAKKAKATKKKIKKKTKKKAAKKKVTKKKVTKKKTKKTTKKKTKKKVAKKAAKKKAPARKQAKISSKRRSSKVVDLTSRASRPAETNSGLGVGELAPEFSLRDQSGTEVSLSQFRGKKVVVYFYPKDDTPGCTREACSFRDHLNQFQGLNAEILGVSFDDQQSHEKFVSKYGLNFTLLSDTEKEVARKYGVYVQKNMYGKTYMGIERSTFVIDTEGRIASIFRGVKVDGHTQEVLEALEEAA